MLRGTTGARRLVVLEETIHRDGTCARRTAANRPAGTAHGPVADEGATVESRRVADATALATRRVVRDDTVVHRRTDQHPHPVAPLGRVAGEEAVRVGAIIEYTAGTIRRVADELCGVEEPA